jgi:hypothetical protein
MSTRKLTSLARLPLLLLRGSDDPGAAPAAYRRYAQSRDLADPDGRVPLSMLWAVWRDVLTHDPDPTLGLRLGRRITVRSLGLVGYVLATSRTLGDALDRFSRYCRILHDGIECHIDRSAGTVRIVFHDHAMVDWAARPQADVRLAGLLHVCRRLTGKRIVPRAVDFPYGRPARIGEHRRTFGTDRLRFARAYAALTLSGADVARPWSRRTTRSPATRTLATDLLADVRAAAPGRSPTTWARAREHARSRAAHRRRCRVSARRQFTHPATPFHNEGTSSRRSSSSCGGVRPMAAPRPSLDRRSHAARPDSEPSTFIARSGAGGGRVPARFARRWRRGSATTSRRSGRRLLDHLA